MNKSESRLGAKTATCEVCGNVYDKCFEVKMGGHTCAGAHPCPLRLPHHRSWYGDGECLLLLCPLCQSAWRK